MKLFYAPASPYARKVRACAIARGIDRQLSLVETDPNRSAPELLAVNPLSKVPALLTDDGVAIYDSPVICEFLDSVGDALPLFPVSRPARWRALLHQAQGDGIMDAAVRWRGENLKPKEPAREAFMARQLAAVTRMLAELEREPPHAALDIGTIAVGCALGYLDYRLPELEWREGHPRLVAWFAELEQQPAFQGTMPRELA
jgi:glutathione S-transferase